MKSADSKMAQEKVNPLKAFMAQVSGYADSYIPAKTSSKARWIVVRSMRESGFTVSGSFHMVRVVRAPQYDKWTLAARPIPITLDGLLFEFRNK